MKVKELLKELKILPPEKEVVIHHYISDDYVLREIDFVNHTDLVVEINAGEIIQSIDRYLERGE